MVEKKEIDKLKPVFAPTSESDGNPEISQEGQAAALDESIDISDAERKLDIGALADGREELEHKSEIPASNESEVKFPPEGIANDKEPLRGSTETESQGIRPDNMASAVTKKSGVPLTDVIKGIRQKAPDSHVMSREAGALHDAAADDKEELDKAA